MAEIDDGAAADNIFNDALATAYTLSDEDWAEFLQVMKAPKSSPTATMIEAAKLLAARTA